MVEVILVDILKYNTCLFGVLLIAVKNEANIPKIYWAGKTLGILEQIDGKHQRTLSSSQQAELSNKEVDGENRQLLGRPLPEGGEERNSSRLEEKRLCHESNQFPHRQRVSLTIFCLNFPRSTHPIKAQRIDTALCYVHNSLFLIFMLSLVYYVNIYITVV